MTLQFLKSNVAVFNLHENLRSKFLNTLNLTKDERKKYANGRLTPFWPSLPSGKQKKLAL